MIITKRLTHSPPHSFLFYVCVVRTLNLQSFSNFQVYNKVLLTIVPMLHIRTQNFSTIGNSYPWTTFTHFPHSALLLVTTNLLSDSMSLFVFKFLREIRLYSTYLFLTFFTSCNAFKVYQSCWKWQNFLLFHG